MKNIKDVKNNNSFKHKNRVYQGGLLIIFLLLCIMVSTGMRQSGTCHPILAIRMAFCEEAGMITGVNLTSVETTVNTSVLDDTFSQKAGTWHRMISDSVNDLIDGEVAITEARDDFFATIEDCRIGEFGNDVEVSAIMDKIPTSDDSFIYLFALESYEEIGDSEPVASNIKSNKFKIIFGFDKNTNQDLLFDSYVLAVKNDGEYQAISDKFYIVNPEILAEIQEDGPKAESIKGLLLDPAMLLSEELDKLSCKQIVYNIPIANLLGETSDEIFPTVYYTYHGKQYAFNGYTVAGYDGMFSYLQTKGIVITAIVLNNLSKDYINLIHPFARDTEDAPYYELNTAEEDGCELIEAVASFLGERYSGKEHGHVSNWIIGNEINQREKWNYIQYMSVDEYAMIYENSFRIFYQAIKSHNAKANIYFSIDQMWNANDGTDTSFYNGKELLDAFNEQVKKHGNIDWGLALHPYSYPLNKVECWTDEVEFGENASVVSMKNINVATDYMQKDALRNPLGEVRSIILSEIGFTSISGEEMQAAAFAYGYYMASHNEYIDALLVNRMTDSQEEIDQGLALGLQTLDGRHKKIWDIFAHIDEKDSGEYTEFALKIIDEERWEDIIPDEE